MLAALAPVARTLVATRSANPARSPPRRWPRLAARHFEAVTNDDPIAALAEARRRAGAGGLVVACGSLFLIGELRAHLRGEAVDPTPTSDPVGSGAAAVASAVDLALADA